jgi:glycosyltransferase involved in cell wall biosynthesis
MKTNEAAVAPAAGSRQHGSYVLLINAFEKVPGENFRDQRYTFLYESLKARARVGWLSSDFHHWSHSKRSVQMLPIEDRPNIKLIRTLGYKQNVSLRRFVSYFALSFATLWNLVRLRTRPDVIVCMGPVEQMFLVVLYGRLRNIPVVIDVIDPWPDVYVRAFPSKLQWLAKILLAPYFVMSYVTFALCDRVSAVSETYLVWARRRGRRPVTSSTGLYYLGARNEDFEIHPSEAAAGKITCLFAGQFGFSYDIELILEAAKVLQAEGDQSIRFVLCGAGPKGESISQAIQTLKNVELHGWLNPSELNVIGANCNVGLCCYRSSATQSLPTKVFDYLSMGLHVVSSLAGEAEILLAEYTVGSSYTAGNVSNFVNCLKTVRKSVDVSVAARRQIRRVFEKYFDSTVIYDRMIDELILPLAAERLRRQE